MSRAFRPGLYVVRVYSDTNNRLLWKVESRCFGLDRYPEAAQQAATAFLQCVRVEEPKHTFAIVEIKPEAQE